MSEVLLGEVTHYFGRIMVAVLKLSGAIAIGDQIEIRGRRTEFGQTVLSLQIEHQSIERAEPGDDVALQVLRPVRRGDRVFKILPDQPA